MRALDGRNGKEDFARRELWAKIVRAYSRTSLTVEKDKLIALSGIAKKMTSVINDEYIAGLWRKSLTRQLLWKVNNERRVDGTPSSRLEAYCAPSWSWASIEGMIDIDTGKDEARGTTQQALFSVIDVKIEHKTDDINSSITAGYIDLRGHLAPFRLLKRLIGGHTGRWQVEVNGVIVRPSEGKLPEWKRLSPKIHFDVPPQQQTFDRLNEESKLFYMLGQESKSEHDSLECLLLTAVDEEKATYERFGYCWCEKPEEIDILKRGVVDRKKVPCMAYDNGSYTVRLI